MTVPRKTPGEPRIPDPQPRDQDLRELRDLYDLPFPDVPGRWPSGRPEYVVVVDQLRDWQPGQPPSLAELLETRSARTREPEQTWKPNYDRDPEMIAMTLTINDTTMTSDQTAHTAQRAPDSQHRWEVSWLPGQPLNRNTAITAMILADTAAREHVREGHRLWPAIQSWAAELGLTGPEAVTATSQPPSDTNRQHEQPGRQPDREAAD